MLYSARGSLAKLIGAEVETRATGRRVVDLDLEGATLCWTFGIPCQSGVVVSTLFYIVF